MATVTYVVLSQWQLIIESYLNYLARGPDNANFRTVGGGGGGGQNNKKYNEWPLLSTTTKASLQLLQIADAAAVTTNLGLRGIRRLET